MYADHVDTAIPLAHYEGAPPHIYEALPESVDLHLAAPKETDELLQMVKDNFAEWFDG